MYMLTSAQLRKELKRLNTQRVLRTFTRIIQSTFKRNKQLKFVFRGSQKFYILFKLQCHRVVLRLKVEYHPPNVHMVHNACNHTFTREQSHPVRYIYLCIAHRKNTCSRRTISIKAVRR